MLSAQLYTQGFSDIVISWCWKLNKKKLNTKSLNIYNHTDWLGVKHQLTYYCASFTEFHGKDLVMKVN